MKKQYYVYLAMNDHNTVVYTGVTNNLIRRITEHKNGIGSVFTSKYQIHKLVYYEVFDDIGDAIMREKNIKAGSRKKKDQLIISKNPSYHDLYQSIAS